MINNDFTTFWQIGRALLAGQNPYLVPHSVYPPAALFLFAPFALFPEKIGFLLWLLVCCGLLILALRKSRPTLHTLGWFAYTPALFILAVGQLDIFFFWLSTFLEEKSWRAVAAAAVITLKPQLAVFILPWVLLKWLVSDWRKIPAWLACLSGLHLAPLLLDPTIYRKWLGEIGAQGSRYIINSPGIFSLTGQDIPEWALAIPAVLIIALALRLPREGFLAGLLLAGPIGTWYNTVLLAGSTPWYVLIPASWAAVLLSYLAHAPYPFALIPLAAWLWHLVQLEEKQEKECVWALLKQLPCTLFSHSSENPEL